jgi:hypothetical protein
VVSFTLEQLAYLSGTAEFVPKWMPPGQMFWAVVTTIAFTLAAVALLSGRSGTFCPSSFPIVDRDGDRFRVAGMAAGAF